MDRIVIVLKRTRLNELVIKYSTEGAAKFAILSHYALLYAAHDSVFLRLDDN